MDSQSVKCVVNALVLSRLDYCNSLFVGLPGDLLKRLQHVQNSAARTILNLPRREPVRRHLKSLGWLPTPQRAELKVACLTYRCLNGLAPLHLSKLISPYTPKRDLRSAGKNLLKRNHTDSLTTAREPFPVLPPQYGLAPWHCTSSSHTIIVPFKCTVGTRSIWTLEVEPFLHDINWLCEIKWRHLQIYESLLQLLIYFPTLYSRTTVISPDF